MTAQVIKAEGLGKQYTIGGVNEIGYRTARDAIAGVFRRRVPHVAKQVIWAVRDVSFEANEGDVIGIIGRNGAGKSTLLKILSRITEPTAGRARLHGRVGSLLEVGTGFHPELTGRENVFLNGAILGMRRAEIAAKFDEIVAFAEIETFIDTPVKRYSSGMYVRLAFAVAAHLNDDILIVDEVLAVGDARFQRKCLEKMENVSRHGRTVLFVSHNLPAVIRLCPRALLLERGSIVSDGPSHDVGRIYMRSDIGTRAARSWDEEHAPGNEWVRLRSIDIRDSGGNLAERLDIRSPATISITWDVLKTGRVLIPTLQFTNESALIVFCTQDLDPAWRRRRRPAGQFVSRVTIPGNFFAEGTLTINVSINTVEPPEMHVLESDAIAFDVVESFAGDSARGDWGGEMPGFVRPLLPWTNEMIPPER